MWKTSHSPGLGRAIRPCILDNFQHTDYIQAILCFTLKSTDSSIGPLTYTFYIYIVFSITRRKVYIYYTSINTYTSCNMEHNE